MLLRNKIGKRLSMHPFLKLILPPLGRVGGGISRFEHPFLKLALPPLGRVGGYQVIRAITILSFPY